MTLDEFKGIFWWEYFHRLLGRAIGVVFLVPLPLVRRAAAHSRRATRWKLAGIFVLGGLQGAMGWYMVKSGLVDDPRVTQFRLTAHLGLALAIFAAMFWVGLSLVDPRRAAIAAPAQRSTRRFAIAVRGARLRDGADRRLRRRHPRRVRLQHVPADERQRRAARDPHARAVVAELLQEHGDRAVRPPGARVAARVRRAGALVEAAVGATACRRAHGRAAIVLLALLALQITLGIATLLLVVPVPLAAAHQAGAVLVFAAALNVAHALR